MCMGKVVGSCIVTSPWTAFLTSSSPRLDARFISYQVTDEAMYNYRFMIKQVITKSSVIVYVQDKKTFLSYERFGDQQFLIRLKKCRPLTPRLLGHVG